MKIYLIGLYADKDDYSDVQCILKATTSYSAAKKFSLDEVEKIKNYKNRIIESVYTNDNGIEWDVSFKYDVKEGDPLYGKEYEWLIRIEEIELDGDDVPEDMIPELEKRCSSLEKCNDELKDENARLGAKIAKAYSYTTFYDGGIYERFDHLLDNIHKIRGILRDEK